MAASLARHVKRFQAACKRQPRPPQARTFAKHSLATTFPDLVHTAQGADHWSGSTWAGTQHRLLASGPDLQERPLALPASCSCWDAAPRGTARRRGCNPTFATRQAPLWNERCHHLMGLAGKRSAAGPRLVRKSRGRGSQPALQPPCMPWRSPRGCRTSTARAASCTAGIRWGHAVRWLGVGHRVESARGGSGQWLNVCAVGGPCQHATSSLPPVVLDEQAQAAPHTSHLCPAPQAAVTGTAQHNAQARPALMLQTNRLLHCCRAVLASSRLCLPVPGRCCCRPGRLFRTLQMGRGRCHGPGGHRFRGHEPADGLSS